MKTITRAVLIIAALGAAACTNPDRFGGGAGGAGAAGSAGLGDASNPRSPAYFQQTVGDRVLFAVDQSTLSDVARATLVQQAAWLMENSEYSATIEGHADEQGTREYNIALSARRASAVIQFLINQGIAANRLKPLPLGKERPVAICSTEECYSQNRRAVTVLTAGAGV